MTTPKQPDALEELGARAAAELAKLAVGAVVSDEELAVLQKIGDALAEGGNRGSLYTNPPRDANLRSRIWWCSRTKRVPKRGM